MIVSTFSRAGNPPNAVSRRRWWVLGTILGALLVAVTLMAARPPTPGGEVGAVRTPLAAPSAVPQVTTTGTHERVAPVGPTATPSPDDAAPATHAADTPALSRSEPTRVRIPAIDVDSELVALGLQPDGRMEVPAGAFPAGWYTGAPTPGELGPAILAGHVDHGGKAGVFFRLHELEPGDTVEVTRQDGSTAVFRVTRVEQHRKDAFPTAAVYGDIDHAGLRLVTCGGQFDHRAHSYEDNIVAFAELDIAQN